MKLFQYSRWGLAANHWYRNFEFLVVRAKSLITLTFHFDGEHVLTGPYVAIYILRGNMGLFCLDIDIGPWLFNLCLFSDELDLQKTQKSFKIEI